MLEQSKMNGPVYCSKYEGKILASNAINITDIHFGIPTLLTIHTRDGYPPVLLENPADKTGIVINESGEISKYFETVPATANETLHTYYYGVAKYKGERHTYWIKNEPPVDLDEFGDFKNIQLPSSIVGYPYEQTFSFSPELLDLLGDFPATYVDRYKRPLNPEAINHHLFYPISIDKVQSNFKDVCRHHTNFPIVCNLKDTEFCVFDLEPGYSEDEKLKVESYDVIYKEETPRGGMHYLARTNDNTFKYRFSDNLELITNTMITFYGINGEMINKDAKPIATFSDEWTPVGVSSVNFESSDVDMDKINSIVDKLKDTFTMQNFWVRQALDRYNNHSDISRAEFAFMGSIYRNVFEKLQIFQEVTPEEATWILGQFTQNMIPFRLKHNTSRNQIPYLVYSAMHIIQ